MKKIAADPAGAVQNYNEYIRNNNYKDAFIIAKMLITIFPDSPEAWFCLAISKIYQRKIQETIVGLERAIAIDPQMTVARNNLINIHIDETKKAFANGDVSLAMSHIEKILIIKPNHDEASIIKIKYYHSIPDYNTAKNISINYIKNNPYNEDITYVLGESLSEIGDLAKSRKIYERLVAINPVNFWGNIMLGSVCNKMNDNDSAISALKRMINYDPSHVDSKVRLIDILTAAGKIDEANNLSKEVQTKHKSGVGISGGIFGRSGILNPVDMTKEDEKTKWHKNKTINYYPLNFSENSIEYFIEEINKSNVLKNATMFTPNSKIMTFGSCFAGEIRRVFSKYGMVSNQITIPEGLNNTFALKYFFDWALEGDTTTLDYWYDSDNTGNIKIWDGQQKLIRESLKDSDGFIITIGLAEVWRDKKSNIVFWRGVPESIWDENLYEFSISSVHENLDNIKNICNTIHKHCGDKPIFLTLSPIPLNATFMDRSCVVSDCASKSILRAAIEEFMALKTKNVYYWPSFEIIRWLGGHTETRTFGGFNQGPSCDSRHVPPNIVKMIINSFIKCTFIDSNFTEK